LAADQDKLRPLGYGPRVTHYSDLDRQCRRCKRRFIFFAAEQKYWCEELKFPDCSEARECVECRKALQDILEMRKRYEDLVKTRVRTEAQTMELVESAASLIEAGVFSPKGIPRLRGFLNRIDCNPAEGSPLHELKARLSHLSTRGK
jgi:Probable zinc-ribbon domain